MSSAVSMPAVAASRRVYFASVLIVCLFASSGCASNKIVRVTKSKMPRGSIVHLVFFHEYSGWLGALPDWYEIYSISHGTNKMPERCDAKADDHFPGTWLAIQIRNCSLANMRDVKGLVEYLRASISDVESYFDDKVQVSSMTYSLFKPGVGFDDRSSHFAKPKALKFDVSVEYNAADGHLSQRRIVRLTAHELFHIARYVLGRYGDRLNGLGLSEEEMASFFGLCVEADVFGGITRAELGSRSLLFSPELAAGAPTLHGSTIGTTRAIRLFKSLYGGSGNVAERPGLPKLGGLCHRITR